MSPKDIVMYRDDRFGCHRFWEVQSVCLGGLGQEDVIELLNLTEKPAFHPSENVVLKTTFVPEPLLRGALIYTPTKP